MKKRNLLLRISIVIFSVFTILYLIFSFSENAKIGEKAPEFTTQLVNGENYSLSNSRGNYVLLYFWGSWCGPCIRNAPKLVTISEKYKSKFFDENSKLEILSVALEKKEKKWKRVVNKFGFNWELQVVQIHKIVLNSSIANKYGVLEIPSKFLIDPDGNIVLSKTSFSEIEQYLEKRLIKV
ncbi:MAG: redoxin domain-containing protein [Flavobacteriales bacterium]|nr:redoxin domain-containing protein [Flavobacteriales bacterium]